MIWFIKNNPKKGVSALNKSNKKQEMNYKPAEKKKKDPMVLAVCVCGLVTILALPVVGYFVSKDHTPVNNPEVSSGNAGWNSVNGEMFYIDPKTNKKAVGVYNIQGENYLFDNDGGITPGWTTLDGNVVYVSKEGILASGLYQIGSDWFYFDEESFGIYTGFKAVDGNIYCFRDDGKAMVDFQHIDGNDYYFNSDGIMQTGWFQTGDGKNYYANDDGQLATGWKILDDGTHYFMDDFSAANGEVLVDDTVYVFDEFGCPENTAEVTTEAPVVTTEVVTTTEAVTEAVTEAPEITEAPVVSEPVEGPSLPDEPAKKQYLRSDGMPYTGSNSIDGKQYFFDDNGYALPVGFSSYGDNGNVYYTYEDDTVATGLVTIGYAKYFFNGDGVMQKGFQTVDNKTCFFAQDGKMAHGFRVINGYTYFFSWDDGSMQKGYISVRGERYFLDENGVLQQGWINMNGYEYYFASDGRGVEGYRIINGVKYYFNSDGILQKGFQIINGTVYYFGDGAIFPGKYEYNGELRNFNENGMMTE